MKMVGLIFLLVLLGIIFLPWAFVWSLNTLFGLGIAYTFETWLAALLFTAFLGGGSYIKKS